MLVRNIWLAYKNMLKGSYKTLEKGYKLISKLSRTPPDGRQMSLSCAYIVNSELIIFQYFSF